MYIVPNVANPVAAVRNDVTACRGASCGGARRDPPTPPPKAFLFIVGAPLSLDHQTFHIQTPKIICARHVRRLRLRESSDKQKVPYLKNALEVKSESQGVFYITGTAIYNIEGDKEGFLVESQKWIRLWVWKEGKPQHSGRISRPRHKLTLTDKYILCRDQDVTLYSRENGRNRGSFLVPRPKEFPGSDPEFGPMVSQGGLIFLKTTPETHYIFSIQSGKVYFQLWKAETKVEDPIVLRGSMDNVELEVLGKKPNWTIYKQESKIKSPDPIMLVLDFSDKATDQD